MATFDVILSFKQNLRVFLCVYVYSFLFAENLSFCATFQFQIFSPNSSACRKLWKGSTWVWKSTPETRWDHLIHFSDNVVDFQKKTSHAPKNPKAFLLICSSKNNQSPSEKISFKLEKYGMIFPHFQSEKENMFWNMYLVVLVSGFACVHLSLSKRSLPQRFCQCHPMSAGTAELCFFICHIARLEAWHGVINIWGDMMPTKKVPGQSTRVRLTLKCSDLTIIATDWSCAVKSAELAVVIWYSESSGIHYFKQVYKSLNPFGCFSLHQGKNGHDRHTGSC